MPPSASLKLQVGFHSETLLLSPFNYATIIYWNLQLKWSWLLCDKYTQIAISNYNQSVVRILLNYCYAIGCYSCCLFALRQPVVHIFNLLRQCTLLYLMVYKVHVYQWLNRTSIYIYIDRVVDKGKYEVLCSVRN